MDVNDICNKPISGELFPGRIIAVKHVTRTAPVPAWVSEVATEYSGVVTNPWLVDASAARAEEIAAAELWKPKPRHYLPTR